MAVHLSYVFGLPVVICQHISSFLEHPHVLARRFRSKYQLIGMVRSIAMSYQWYYADVEKGTSSRKTEYIVSQIRALWARVLYRVDKNFIAALSAWRVKAWLQQPVLFVPDDSLFRRTIKSLTVQLLLTKMADSIEIESLLKIFWHRYRAIRWAPLQNFIVELK